MIKKFSIIIPARLKSTRYPNKLFEKINNIPILEHVRRRALLVGNSEVYVASSDIKIINYVLKNKGKIIRTKKRHFNGTSRAAEAVEKIKSKYIIILQADEPLINPREIQLFMNFISESNKHYYNCVGVVKNKEMEDISVVKSYIYQGKIMECFRDIRSNKKYKNYKIFKLFGLIGFERKALINLNKKERTYNEKKYKIEQMKILDHSLPLYSFLIKGTTTSVNYKRDLIKIKREFNHSKLQQRILKKIL